MPKHLPLAIAAAAIVATQIACTFFVVRDEPVADLFVDDVDQIVYDGQVIRVDLRRAWLNDHAQTEMKTVGRLVLTKHATLQLHKDLAELLAVVHQPPPAPSSDRSAL